MTVCRTCLSTCDLQPIFSDHNAFSFSSTELFLVTGVEIHRNDGLSQLICKTCIKLIESALRLRQQSSKANAILRRKVITDNVTVKVEANNLDIEGCKRLGKTSKPVKLLDISDNDSQDIYNTIDYDLVMEPSKKQNQTLVSHKQKKNIASIKPNTSSSKIKNSKSENEPNIKMNSIFKTEAPSDIPKEKNVKDPMKCSKECLLRIEDLESSDSENEGSNIRIEDFESSDSFDVDMDLISDDIKIKPSGLNRNVYERRILLAEDKKYLEYCKRAKERETKQKQRREALTKEILKKYLSLAVTPYNMNGPIQCRVCYSTVRTFNSFKTHAKTHFEPQFSCEVCGKKFTSNILMRYHQQRMHGRTKRLGCSYCSFRSVDRQTLRNHERAEHTGERPYTCNECGVSFRMRNNLIQHLRKHFGVKNMQCERCPAMFRSRSELWGHQSKVHFMSYNYYCYLCPESYKGPGPVKKHLLNVHGVPEEQQLKIKCVKTRK